jgi:hypothetical protein
MNEGERRSRSGVRQRLGMGSNMRNEKVSGADIVKSIEIEPRRRLISLLKMNSVPQVISSANAVMSSVSAYVYLY